MIKSAQGVLYARYIDALLRGEKVVLEVPLLSVRRIQKGLTNEKYIRPLTSPKTYLHFDREALPNRGDLEVVKLTVTLSTHQRKRQITL